MAEFLPTFNAQVRALKPGQCVAKAERFEMGSDEAANITETLGRLRRTVNAAVSRLREDTGNEFKVESGAIITSDNEAILAVVSVARL